MQNGSSATFKCSAMANHWHGRSRYVTETNCSVLVITTLVSRIFNKHRLTIDVKDRSRSGRPRITTRRENYALGRLVRQNPFAISTVLKRLDTSPVAICKSSPKSSEICLLSFKKTSCKEMFTNTSTQSFPFAMMSNTWSMEFGLVEESSFDRRKSLLAARDRWQSARMATTEHCLC
jgi:hypothetical protein